MTKTKKESKTNLSKISFQEAYKKVLQITEEIETGSLDLDLLTQKINEAKVLINICKEKLYQTEQDVKQLLNEEN